MYDQSSFEPALAAFERAAGLFQTENNADSDLRAARLRVAELQAGKFNRFVEAAKLFEAVAEGCTKIKLLSFQSRGHFVSAFLCLAALDDTVALQEAAERFVSLDLNLEGSGEGDFMMETVAAVDIRDFGAWQTAVARLEQRVSVRGNAFWREMLYKVGSLYGRWADAGGDLGDIGELEQDDEDIL